MEDIEYYDWVPFFKELCHVILGLAGEADREQQLYRFAEAVFLPKHKILEYDHTDPFSFIYAFAQRNTPHQWQNYFNRAKSVFGLSAPVPTDRIFPTPSSNSPVLFCENGSYMANTGQAVGSDAIWRLFASACNGEPGENADFLAVLSLKYVRITKLSQVLFLVNPEQYMPFDTQMNALPIPELDDLKPVASKIETEGISAYLEVIALLQSAYRGCKLYEINLLNVLINSPFSDHLKLNNTFFQISSWADGKEDSDYFDDFTSANAVWTGGPGGLTGKVMYAFDECYPGDIMLVRRGTKWLGGMGVVLSNQYLQNGYDPDSVIKILWLVKDDRKLEDALGQWLGFGEATAATREKFRQLYPQTFELIDFIRRKQKTMVNHSVNTHKNIILQGPPGTGKTRKALQIAQWLTSGKDHSLTLMEAIDQNIFQGDPNIDDIEEAELIQFHPSYTYEDFVRGISTFAVGDKLDYRVENKILAKMAAKAGEPENRMKAFVLVIDEINRANLSAVLGELIYALEYRDRKVDTLYAYDGSHSITLPGNLYIIGTMNTADRSVGHIDYAIRRRFSFVPVLPDSKAITNTKARALFEAVSQLFNKHTSPEFNPDDVRIGHSYFLGDESELVIKLKYDILPILMEYLRDGVLMDTAEEDIAKLHA